jgi:hypothetical protein
MNLELTDEQAAALPSELDRIIDRDAARYRRASAT